MRIACLQFAPQVGDVDNNLNRADAVLSRANPEDLDLLVLPELAFTGMFQKQINYPKSLRNAIRVAQPAPCVTASWRNTFLRYLGVLRR
jgi:protein N-terminal amidase